MEDIKKTMRLREWIITQIESGKYSGLCWENSDKTMFRIPWKHAAKQDYKQDDDAALFKAWAVYKRKYVEGKDKADPSVWKTRLRCALNKSTDFQEVPERSQLDISEPYKVYKLQPETDGQRKLVNVAQRERDTPLTPDTKPHVPCGFRPGANRVWEDRADPVYLYQTLASMDTRTLPVGALADSGENAKRDFYLWSVSQPLTLGPARLFAPTDYQEMFQITDFRLRVHLFYQGQLVLGHTTSSPGGCRILHGAAPVEDECSYRLGPVEQICFPLPRTVQVLEPLSKAMAQLLPHLERGVLLWAASDGIFIKRLCQGRVYWSGPLAQHRDRPNKLEREQTYKLLDMYTFLQELRQFLQGSGTQPNFEIDLCFGEEYPEPSESRAKKLITAQIEPLFAQSMMQSVQKIPVEAVLCSAPDPPVMSFKGPQPPSYK